MITKWSIANFKSFRNRTDIELAPVTVFAGANSSGKSTIIQSILLLKQTLQYAPATRALALNGPLVKLGAFNDVKNAASEEQFIGIGWELNLDHTENIVSRSNAFGTGLYASALWGQSSLKSVKGKFLWEMQSSEDKGAAGLPDALLQLQPKLTVSEIEASIPTKDAAELRALSIIRSTRSSPLDIARNSEFQYQVKNIDETSRKEILESKPDGTIIAASARHFLPGRLVVQYDGARERAFRVSNILCAGSSPHGYRQQQVNGSIVPLKVIELFRHHLAAAEGHEQVEFPFWGADQEKPITVERFAD
jgi:AAA ATPase domain